MASIPNIVFDTSTFTNPASFRQLGRSPADALNNVLAHLKGKADVYMTPGCFAEFEYFVVKNQKKERKSSNGKSGKKAIELKPKLLVTLHRKTANADFVQVSGSFTYELVCGFRERGDAALKYAVALVKEAYETEPEERKKGQPDPVTQFITRLRDGLRHHMREGFIDSGPDLDTLLLAKELGARLVTSDNGMVKYAEKLGVDLLAPELVLHL